ncbi:MAG: ABC transporter ATP-binding protein/permease [Anaerolineae bacterium]|nr:ABC transporter ATP-binding protein/permease [Anaerolineae bacterium]
MKLPLRAYVGLLAQYLKPQWLRASLLGLLLLGDIALRLVNPQIVAGFIDGVTTQAAPGLLLRYAGLYLSLALLQQGIAVLTTYQSEAVSWTATNALRTDLVAHTLGLDPSFHKAHRPGEMIERIDGDVTAISNFFSQFIIQILGNSVLVVGVIIVLVRVDWRVSAVVGSFAVATLAVLLGLRNIAVPHYDAERQAAADLFGFLEERLAGTEDIRANGARAYVMRGFQALMRDLLRKSLKAALMINYVFNATFILVALGIAGAFAVGAFLYRRDLITIGTVFLVYTYTSMLETPLRAISHQLQELQRASAGIGRVRLLLEARNRLDEVDAGHAHGLPSGALAVHVDGVTFAYSDQPHQTVDGYNGGQPLTSEAALRDITFSLAPGTVLGLLGRTGSGKTTLTRLLLRFYDVDEGSVRLGPVPGTDVREVHLARLRQRVSIVTQDIQLFSASVRDNLTFFDGTVPDERLHEAIEALGLGPWLASLPNGLDTMLEGGGGGLSAGQAQLLAFGRIFLRDPGLVVLDEASSRLDPATEQLIEHAVDRLLEGRTAIIIAHRLNTIARADEVMILEDGRILERGTRDFLAADPASHFHGLLETGLEEVMV